MHPAEHYIALRKRFPQHAEHQELDITLEEMARALNCTTRNVKILLKRMKDEAWIAWQPGRGRGNTSKLSFRMPLEQMLMEQAQELVERGDLRRALEQLDEMEESSTVRGAFFDWLVNRFGPRTEHKQEKECSTLVVPYYKPAENLDPAFTVFALDSHIARHVFDTLVRFISATGKIEPHLAYAWESSADEMTWTFYLRKSVLFHNGKEMTADDVVYSIERLRDPGVQAPFSWMVKTIGRVEAVCSDVVRFHLSQQNRMFLRFLSSDRMSIVPEDAAREAGSAFGRKPVGTGPFRLTHFDGTKMVLEAFPLYFRERALLDRVEFWIVPGLRERGAWPKANLEAMQYFPFIDQSAELPWGWEGAQTAGIDTKYVLFNQRKPGVMQDYRFRRALSLAIRKASFEQERQEELSPSCGFMYEGVGMCADGLTASPGAELYSDEDIRHFLNISGYDGRELVLGFTFSKDHDANRIAEIAAKYGIRMRTLKIPNCEFGDVSAFSRADLIISGVIIDREDPHLSLIETYEPSNGYIRRFLGDQGNAELDKRIAVIAAEASDVVRTGMLRALDEWLEEDAGIVFLYHRHMKTTYHPSMKGVQLNGIGWVDFSKVWFARD